jgi:hypothetical protein
MLVIGISSHLSAFCLREKSLRRLLGPNIVDCNPQNSLSYSPQWFRRGAPQLHSLRKCISLPESNLAEFVAEFVAAGFLLGLLLPSINAKRVSETQARLIYHPSADIHKS